MEKNGRLTVSRVTICIHPRETVGNKKMHIVAMKAIESFGKVEFDHHVISRHTL